MADKVDEAGSGATMTDYRPNIQAAIRGLVSKAGGGDARTRYGDRISVTHGKGRFEVLLVDRAGLGEGWTADWYPYTRKSVQILDDIIKGKRI